MFVHWTPLPSCQQKTSSLATNKPRPTTLFTDAHPLDVLSEEDQHTVQLPNHKPSKPSKVTSVTESLMGEKWKTLKAARWSSGLEVKILSFALEIPGSILRNTIFSFISAGCHSDEMSWNMGMVSTTLKSKFLLMIIK